MADQLADDRGHSFFIVDNAVLTEHGATIGVFGVAVYAVIVMHAGKDLRAWPSRATIAKILNCSIDSVDRAIAKLVDVGLIAKSARHGDKGQASNLYRLTPLNRTVAAPPAADSGPPSRHGRPPQPLTAARIRPIEQDPLNKEYPSIVNETMDGAPVAPAGHSTNGTGPAPAKTRTRRKATPRTPLQLGQGSTIYRDVVELTPNATQRAMLDAAFEKHGERAMRDGLARWLAKGWSPKNVPGMVDFLDGGDKGRRADAKAEAFWASVQW